MSKRVVLPVALAVLVLAAVGAWLGFRSGSAQGDPQTAARTSFPDVAPVPGPPTLPSLSTLRPAPGTVVEAAGPFDDRFRFHRLVFDGATVSGTAQITSDVSEVLEFEAVAGFYDRHGALVGTARDVYHLDESTSELSHEGLPDEAQHIRIRVPRDLRGVAVAAAVGVPVLVNE